MQYFILSLSIIMGLATLVFAIIRLLNLKYLFLQKILSAKIISRPLFSTVAVNYIARYIIKCPKQEKENLIKFIERNELQNVIKNISDAKAKAILNLIINQNNKFSVDSAIYHIIASQNAVNKQFWDKAINLLQKTSIKLNKDKKINALKLIIEAKVSLYYGDLLVSSEKATTALRIFQKNNMIFEEADTYFLLGNIYRMSGVFDSSEIMYRSALKLFRLMSCNTKEVETIGTMGLLMVSQNRFSEALEYYNAAEKILDIFPNEEMSCFLSGQKSLLELVKGDVKQAKFIAEQTLQKCKKTICKAFILDVYARILFVMKKWDLTIKYAYDAVCLYQKNKNYAAEIDISYLMAESLLNNNELNKAENCLREIIRRSKQHKTCFHIANAYTLLGLILFKKNDIRGAKTIFYQSLEQELCNERKEGIAIDYANLAIVEKKIGNSNSYVKNLNKALEYAKDCDNELYSKIAKLIDQKILLQ